MKRVFRHRPLPALGTEAERQVVDEFRRVQIALEGEESNAQGVIKAEVIACAAPTTVSAAVNAHAFTGDHADQYGNLCVDVGDTVFVAYCDSSYQYFGPVEKCLGSGSQAGKYPAYTTVDDEWVSQGTSEHNQLNARDAANGHPQSAIGGRGAFADLQLDQAGQDTKIVDLEQRADVTDTEQATQDSRLTVLESVSTISTHNDLAGRDATNAHPLASITGVQTGGAGNTFLNDQGLYSTPGSGFDGDHNDLPGRSALNAHPLTSITGISISGSGNYWLNDQGNYTAPPSFSEVHADLVGRSVADAHPVSAITGLESRLSALETAEPWVYRRFTAKDIILPASANYTAAQYSEAIPADGVGANGNLLLVSFVVFAWKNDEPNIATAVLEFPSPSDWDALTMEVRYMFSVSPNNNNKTTVMRAQAYVASIATDLSAVSWTGGTDSVITAYGTGLNLQMTGWLPIDVLGIPGADRQVFYRFQRNVDHASDILTGAMRIHSVEVRFSR